ncbi:hypothetical protein [Lewinella sp. IMCC34183]|uniref:hypothetical protein n=1 Tax=Lewinella sp. IMCC34183 TaxID=2248762 RepID=UPI0013003CCA|nr:hypothetical protein [Lewinella sp. IMCC34183]
MKLSPPGLKHIPSLPLPLAFVLLLAWSVPLAGEAANDSVRTGEKPSPWDPSYSALLAGERWLEAECGRQGEEWQPDSTDAASNRLFVYFPGNNRHPRPETFGGPSQLTYTVDLSVTAAYTLYLRLNASGQHRNSIWVSIDDGPWAKFSKQRDQQRLMTEGFEWREVVDDGVPLDLTLSEGEHTIRVAAHETGMQLDKLFLSPSGRHPAGTGPIVPACSRGPASTLIGDNAPFDAAANLVIYPDFFSNVLRVRLLNTTIIPSNFRDVCITGSDGREYPVRPIGPVTRTETHNELLLNFRGLQPGVYTLRFREHRLSSDYLEYTFIKTN